MAGGEKSRIGWLSAAALVIANMIGTGVFTSLGFQLMSVQNTWSIVFLWLTGGIMALFGAFSYAELGTRLPRSGGEYHYISETIHPLPGYLSGWVSLTVGFAAPVALAAMAMASYLNAYVPIRADLLAAVTVTLISVVHSIHLKQSERFQNVFTVIKLLVIITLIGLCFALAPDHHYMDWSGGWKTEVLLPAYAVSLVFVSYAYSGWNAAAYIVEEIRDVRKNLPIALIAGTAVVAVLYVLVQLAFLRAAPVSELTGKVEVGQVAATAVLGPAGGQAISLIIAVLLVSSISAMVWVGPRVTKAIGDDHRLWRGLSVLNANGLPVRAIWLQWFISVVLILTGSFEQVLLYSGFILQAFSMLAVIGMIRLRIRQPDLPGYRSPFFPFIQIIFLLFGTWILAFMIYDRPQESLFGVFNLLVGIITYFWSMKIKK